MPTYTRTGEGPQTVRRVDNQLIEVYPRESVKTFTVLGDGWTKTSDEPYYTLGHIQVPVVSDGETPVDVTGLKGFRFLQVITDGSDVVVTANAADNPYGYPLIAGTPFFISNIDGNIDVLWFSGTGNVNVVGLDR